MAVRGIILDFSPYRPRQFTVRRNKAHLLLDGRLGGGRLQHLYRGGEAERLESASSPVRCCSTRAKAHAARW
jgi:hypothetical protein